jgi:hypothetical protein
LQLVTKTRQRFGSCVPYLTSSSFFIFPLLPKKAPFPFTFTVTFTFTFPFTFTFTSPFPFPCHLIFFSSSQFPFLPFKKGIPHSGLDHPFHRPLHSPSIWLPLSLILHPFHWLGFQTWETMILSSLFSLLDSPLAAHISDLVQKTA